MLPWSPDVWAELVFDHWQGVRNLRGSGGATCAAFSADGLQLHTAGMLLSREEVALRVQLHAKA